MKKLLALTLPLLLAAMASRADVIWQEQFNYSNGPVSITSTNGTGSTTISNWITHSGSQDCYVNNHRLEVSTSSANGGVTVTRSGDINRQFSMTNGSPYTNVHQLIYASFIVNFTNLPTVNGGYFAHFHYGAASSASTYEGRLFALIGNPAQPTNNFAAQPNTYRLGISTAAQSTYPNKVIPIDLALNTDYQVVLGWDPVNLGAMILWVNPTSSSDPSVISGDAFTATASDIVNAFAFRQASGFGGFLTVSNLIVATTFDDAFTNSLATNAVAPKVVYQPVGTTNFVGATFNLSAIVAGQGQASMTYQWFQGANPYSNPAGNTNVLGFANAQATDSGNYTLVATTPYGLSVTSAVAKVSISANPVPPVFLTQPVSKTVFRGDTVIFSTTVSSPGTVNYQWFSNNVAIAGANSSTYELDNVLTSFSANYKVAVTNDVVVNGIVSSNAVLTVQNPNHVSISFLRKLVDPVTYQSTNSAIPYEITGTVTTYTNITTGNTSSYYLQDGTAGINIFATFASSFHPAQGAVVTFVGVTSSFTSGLELYANPTTLPYTSYTDTGTTAALPTPIAIPFTVTNNNLSNVTYSIAGSIVQLSNVYFGTNGGNYATNFASLSSYSINVTNAGGQSIPLTFFVTDHDTTNAPLPAFASSVTGVLYGNVSNYAIGITKLSDIVAGTPVVSPIPLGLSYAGGNLTFNWTDSSFTLQTATNVTGPYIDIPGATTGFVTNSSSSGLPVMFFRLSHP